jgi:hypothetical protein
VDDGGRIEVIRDLCSFEGRGPGTDAERRAGNMLAERLRRMGRRADIEPTYVHPQYALVHFLHCALALAGSIVAVWEPAIGFGLVLIAATSMYLDLNTRYYLLRTLLFRRASQNVVSRGTKPEAPLRLILVAHYDAARSGYVFGERGMKLARRLPERWRLLLGPWRVIFWAGIAPLLPIIGARMAGVDADWLAFAQLVPTMILIVASFLLVDIALSAVVPGAYDNASGVAAVLSTVDDLVAEPAENLDVWVVLAGAEECLCEGMRAFVKEHRDVIDRDRTLIVNVDSVSYGSPHYVTSQGGIISFPMDPELVELCEALGASAAPGEGPAARPVRSPVIDDAMPAAVRRLRAITITGLDEGVPPPWYHDHADTPDRVNPASLRRASDFVTSLVRLIDRQAGRVPAAAPEPVGAEPPR